MSTKDTGGQAFPCYERGSAGAGPLELTDPGMTLRDYFAAKAMQGVLANANNSVENSNVIGKLAYLIADFMLKARKA